MKRERDPISKIRAVVLTAFVSGDVVAFAYVSIYAGLDFVFQALISDTVAVFGTMLAFGTLGMAGGTIAGLLFRLSCRDAMPQREAWRAAIGISCLASAVIVCLLLVVVCPAIVGNP